LLDNPLLQSWLAVNKMSVVSVYGVANYSEGELKLISQGENAVDSQHVTDVMYDGTVGIV